MSKTVMYKNSLYSNKQIDFTHQPMFFGDGKNTQRFDVMKYEWYDKSNNDQQGNDWTWDEVTISKDIHNHETKADEGKRHIIKTGLQRAIFLDSINGRGPAFMFGQVATIPEVEANIFTWNHFEVNKHSRTYTKHLRALYKHPDVVFDESFIIPELTEVSDSVSSVYNMCYMDVIEFIYKQQRELKLTDNDMERIKSSFLMAWIEVNALEGVRFYPFFASIWGMHKTENIMAELTEDLIFICRDENEHLALTQYTLALMKRKKEEGFYDVFRKLLLQIKERFYQIYEEEKRYVKYLFSKGSYLGMNEHILIDYINFIIVQRMRAIGIEPDANKLDGKLVLKHPIKWVEQYIHADLEERRPQQQNVLNYVTNGVNHDVDDHTKLESVRKYLKDLIKEKNENN